MLEIILSQLYACEICLAQLTTSSYKQRVTHWESRLQADLSSTCRHVGTLEAQFLPIQSALDSWLWHIWLKRHLCWMVHRERKSWSTLAIYAPSPTQMLLPWIWVHLSSYVSCVEYATNDTARFHRNGIRNPLYGDAAGAFISHVFKAAITSSYQRGEHHG